MARYDKDTDTQVITNNGKTPGKTKGEMSIREAAAQEMPEQHLETSMPGTVVHGFGSGQPETMKRHTGSGESWTPGTGDKVTALVEQLFQLPFQAQLGVMRMIAPRILGAMDARDQEAFINDLRMEVDSEGTGDTRTQAQSMNTEDIQGT
ncbi:hypothetical protein ACN28E_14830 [Archangium lansingense]|uniref:hypothetical protein n=1 Tax=Archangium lansingense TaxID=2995310 RepID=UPI003B7CB4C5